MLVCLESLCRLFDSDDNQMRFFSYLSYKNMSFCAVIVQILKYPHQGHSAAVSTTLVKISKNILAVANKLWLICA